MGGSWKSLNGRVCFRFEGKSIACFFRPRMNLLADKRKKLLRSTARLTFVDACRPAGSGQGGSGRNCRHQCFFRKLIAGNEVAYALFKPTPAPPALAFRAPYPAAQLRRLKG